MALSSYPVKAEALQLQGYTKILYFPWCTNLLPIPEDTLSAVLVFSTTLTTCYMALHLHKSIVVMSSVKDLDQPFINDHQPLLWLGMQKGVSHSDSHSSLSLIYLNFEEKVRIQEGSIVMKGPGPIWAKQPNTELRDYVWDPG
ncbi:hypothetical protein R3W88_022179 [Solanum pinnatisectum]|uniref:Uncharacterized protein n=1 Tax=Solanum pinnatisectum TaxID=50273 RepID=A0AAV9LTV8_9SOLN|nr:hypothetical protein R3W88_022179 [Solanum pinnatisectum]